MVLHGVMTIAEAASRWAYVPQTLHKAITEGRLQATKSAGTWLVAYEDMVAAYGQPKQRGGKQDTD